MVGVDTKHSAQRATCTGEQRQLLVLIVNAEVPEIQNVLCLSFQALFCLSQDLH